MLFFPIVTNVDLQTEINISPTQTVAAHTSHLFPMYLIQLIPYGASLLPAY